MNANYKVKVVTFLLQKQIKTIRCYFQQLHLHTFA